MSVFHKKVYLCTYIIIYGQIKENSFGVVVADLRGLLRKYSLLLSHAYY